MTENLNVPSTTSVAATPTVKEQLQDLIQECLTRDYTSTSCKDEIITGNHYQSVSLGGSKTTGFRSERSEFLDRIRFDSLRVLDLGSNLGELSRAVRARGAELVDGFEYDPFFVDVAQLINAHNSTTRVSFFERDITREETYEGRYDVVMAFAVWTYVEPMLATISNMTDVLLLETHNLHDNFKRDYADRFAHYFPFYITLGESDWGRTEDPSGGRAVVLCTKREATISQILVPTASASNGDDR